MRRPPKLDDRAAGAAAVPSNAARAAGWNVRNASRMAAKSAESTALGRARATLATARARLEPQEQQVRRAIRVTLVTQGALT